MKKIIKRYVFTILLSALALLSAPLPAAEPPGSAYLDAGNSTTALILLHGRGKNPHWKVVESLRKSVFKKLGFHTLSLQMPNDDKNWKEYTLYFPEAFRIIKEGIRFLREEKGVTKIFLMGHSMGGRMASAFCAENSGESLAGLIIAGGRNNGGGVLSCFENQKKIKIPVLDIWGGESAKDVRAAAERRQLLSVQYKQTVVPGANHTFDEHENEFTTAVTNWLESRR